MRALACMMLALLVVSCSMLSRNADDIINDMRDARNAQYVNVGSGLLGLGRLISPTLYDAKIGITSVQLLDLSKCNVSVREKFRKRVQNLYKSRYYEEVMTTQRDYDQQTVLVRRDGEYISEIASQLSQQLDGCPCQGFRQLPHGSVLMTHLTKYY